RDSSVTGVQTCALPTARRRRVKTGPWSPRSPIVKLEAGNGRFAGMADSLWIIGVAMTKFMRYKDKDLIDLGSEAALAALGDAGLTIFDADVLAAGCLFDTGGVGQRIQKQIGQTGIPVYNVVNACATGATAFRVAAMAIKSGEASIGLAVGLEQMGKRGLLGASAGGGGKKYEPSGRYGALGPVEGVLGTSLMPG